MKILDDDFYYVKIEDYYESKDSKIPEYSIIYYKSKNPNIERTYKKRIDILVKGKNGQEFDEKIKKEGLDEHGRALTEFYIQNNRKYLGFDLYQIYDLKGKCLNKPYEPKPEKKKFTERSIMPDKRKLNSFIPKHIPRLTSSEKRKLGIRITSLAAAAMLLPVVSNYALKFTKIDRSKIIDIEGHAMVNANDIYLRVNYERFENIFMALDSGNYSDITNADIDFFVGYLNELADANFDSSKSSMYYKILPDGYLEKNTSEHQFVGFFEREFDLINDGGFYHGHEAYDFCSKKCDFLYNNDYSYRERYNSYVTGEKELYKYSDLTRLIIYTQIRSAVKNTNFEYKKGDEPSWWLVPVTVNGVREYQYNNEALLNRLNDGVDSVISDIKLKIAESKSSSKK